MKNKALIIYFSGTGNTKAVAKEYGRTMAVKGFTPLVRSLEEYLKGSASIDEDMKDASLIAIGGPIYAGNVPDLMINWIRKKVPKAQRAGIFALAFSTSAGLDNAHGINSISSKLKKKGYQVIGQQAYVMPRNFYVDKYAPTPMEDQQRLWAAMPTAVTDHVEASLRSALQIDASMNALVIIGIDLLADVFRIMAKGMGKDYAASDNCTRCGLCVKQCPKGNIQLSDKKAEFGKQCMLCTRCIHQCPVNAISYKGKHIEQYKPQL